MTAGYGGSVQTLLTQVWPVAHGVQAEVHSAAFVSEAQLPFGHMWKVALQA